MVTIQDPVPGQLAPFQPVKVEPGSASAVSVTEAPKAKLAEQVLVQPLIPAGVLVTLPAPVPGILTSNFGLALNIAVTERASLMVTTQVLPEQAPPQLTKVEPGSASAVSVTEAPKAKLAEQVLVQPLIPAGVLVTLPAPVPALLTSNF